MKKMLDKELRLATSPLAWVFLAAAMMAFLPGYPILMSAFFIGLGTFQSFQAVRESNDILYTALLPVPKRDAVLAKYLSVCFFQMVGFAMMTAVTAVRMTLLKDAAVYRTNALMNASPVFLAFALLIFTAFNVCFLGGFFKTAHAIGVPFLAYGVVTLLLVTVGESLHFFPGLRFLNAPGGERMGLQFCALAAAACVYALLTVLSCRASIRRFERIDL
ncbi:MAG: ABC-2 transporter permease [Clostridia bacterium]|nr:ABC-2 transporter permease [Clostridia bacterium]